MSSWPKQAGGGGGGGGGVIFCGSHITHGLLFALRMVQMAPPLIFNSNDNDEQNTSWDDSVRIFNDMAGLYPLRIFRFL